MKTVFRRELAAYFHTMIGYVFVGTFFIMGAIFFNMNNIMTLSSDVMQVLGNLSYLLIILAPLLTMRLLAEERKNKTDQFLFTSPLHMSQIVLGKYCAALAVFAIALALTLVFPVILMYYGAPYGPEVLLGYVGIFLLGAACIAIGLFVSCITENQLIAAVLTMGVLLLLYMADIFVPRAGAGIASELLYAVSLFQHFTAFQMGVLRLDGVLYFISMGCFFVWLTVETLRARRAN